MVGMAVSQNDELNTLRRSSGRRQCADSRIVAGESPLNLAKER